MQDELASAIPDPSLRALLEATESAYRGHDIGVETAVNGARSVIQVEVSGSQGDFAGDVGARITTALNQALDRADDAITTLIRTDPRLPRELRGLVDGDPLPSGTTVSGESMSRDFEGTAAGGLVVVHVSGGTRRFTSVFLDSLTPELVAAVPEAANRAMAAAELGHEGAVPLEEQIDGVLARLDAQLSTIQEGLADVDARLDAIEADLA